MDFNAAVIGHPVEHSLSPAIHNAIYQAKGIPWQTKTWISGGTDASSIQKTACGARVAAISAAVRYIHSPSCVGCAEDFENMLRLARAYLETL